MSSKTTPTPPPGGTQAPARRGHLSRTIEDSPALDSAQTVGDALTDMVRTAGQPTPDSTPTLTDALIDILTPAQPAFTWDDLAAPIPMPSKVIPIPRKVDAIAETPEPIRMRAELSLSLNVAAVADVAASAASRVRVNYVWRVQAVPSVKVAQDFIKALTRYAKYRPAADHIPFADPDSPKGQVTARTGDVTWYRQDAVGNTMAASESADGAFMGVRYSVRPFEARGGARRLPGIAAS